MPHSAVSVFHVYILSSANGVLYTGVTNDLERRIFQHQQKQIPGFTATHDINRLVYFEAHGDIRAAIAREKQVKGWRREKRIALIRSLNPAFRDLSLDFHK